eukprot:gene7567-378_t
MEKLFSEIPAVNIQKFFQSWSKREDCRNICQYINCDKLTFVGDDNADDVQLTRKLITAVPLGSNTYVEIDGVGHCITAESPASIAESIYFFLAGKGWVMAAMDRQLEEVGAKFR